MNRLSIRLLITLILLLLLTSQVAHAKRDREIMRLGRGAATSLDWRPDGKVLAVGSSTGVWVYDENLETLGHFDTKNASQIAWNASGNMIAIVNMDSPRVLEMWRVPENPDNSQLIWTQTWDDGFGLPIDITWEPNGHRLATGTSDNFVRVWDANNGNLLTSISTKSSYVAWSPDGSRLAVSGKEINIYDANTLKIVNTIRQYSEGGKVTWNSDSTLLAYDCYDTKNFSDFDGTCIWDVKTDALKESQELARITWSSNPTQFTYFGTSGFDSFSTWLQIRDLSSQTTPKETDYSAFIIDLRWQPNKEILVALADDGTLIKFDVKAGKFVSTKTQFTSTAQHLTWSPNSKSLLSVQNGSVVTIWNLPQSKQSVNDLITSFETRLGVYTTGTENALWLDDKTFISAEQTTDNNGNWEIGIVQRDALTGHVSDFLGSFSTNCWFSLDSDFKKAACPQPDKNDIEIWNIGDKAIVRHISIPNAAQIQWSPDNQLITVLKYIKQNDVVSTSVEIRDFLTNSLKLTYQLDCCELPIWSPNSQFIAAPTSKQVGAKTINIIETKTFKTTGTIDGENVAWSPNSQLLAVSTGSTLDFYSVLTNKFIESDKTKNISSLAFSPDGKMLALGMNDSTIRIWDVADLMVN